MLIPRVKVGTAIETIPYVYGDSNWKDKLTSYDGQRLPTTQLAIR